MRKFTAVLLGIALFGCALLAGAAELRLLGTQDHAWGSGSYLTPAPHLTRVYRINADIVPFSQDNAVKVGDLYYFAAIAKTGTLDNCLISDGDNTFHWGACGAAGATTTLPWDNITNRPTINSVTVTGAVLDNASNYPTFNQSTTGNAATATTASALSGQYIDWSQSSGATSVANRPTINGVVVTGSVLDNASNYPTLNQNTSGTAAGLTAAYVDWNAGSGGASIQNKPSTFTPASHNNSAHSETYLTTTGSAANLTSFPTLNQNTTGSAASYSGALGSLSGGKLTDNSVALTKLLTSGCTDNQVAKYTIAGGWACAADAVGEVGGGITAVVEDTTPQLGGDLDLNGFVITGFTINGVAVQGTVLDNALNYPTLNQSTTGNATTATTASALSAQYIDWNQSSGATSVANRPTINGSAVTGARLDNAANYPTFNQNTTGTAAGLAAAYVDWNAGSGGASILNKPTLGGLAALDNGANINIGGNAGTATALAADPTDCSPGDFATGIAASGNLTCGTPAGSGDMTKAVYDTGNNGQVDNAALADALAANGANCSAGDAPLGVDASGAVEGCWTPAQMVYPGSGIPNSTGSAWGTSYGLDTDASSVSATDNEILSSKATKAALDLKLSSVAEDTTPALGGNLDGMGNGIDNAVIGGNTPLAGTFTTLGAGAGGFSVDADGDTTVKSLTVTKQSGVAGDMSLYEANSTDTHGAGFRGPASITGDGAYRGQFPNARPSSANMVQAWTNAAESGTGTALDPYIQATSWLDLDDFEAVANKSDNTSLGTSTTLYPTQNAVKSYVDTGLSGKAATDQTMYIGTTQVAINRGSAALALTGITSIDGSAANVAVGSDAQGDILVRGASAYTRLAAVAAGQPLLSGGVSTAPAYAGYMFSATAGQTYTFPGASATLISTGNISDTAYDASSWDGVTGIAPSKNAVRDKIETLAAISRTKTFSFAIDNVVVATDNILLWRSPVAITITRADCYASTDNVVGDLMECSTSDVTSCTVLDSWTVTNAVDPFTDSSMTDGAVAAGAWIRWSTTSVGTTNSNKLSCTIQYNE